MHAWTLLFQPRFGGAALSTIAPYRLPAGGFGWLGRLSGGALACLVLISNSGFGVPDAKQRLNSWMCIVRKAGALIDPFAWQLGLRDRADGLPATMVPPATPRIVFWTPARRIGLTKVRSTPAHSGFSVLN